MVAGLALTLLSRCAMPYVAHPRRGIRDVPCLRTCISNLPRWNGLCYHRSMNSKLSLSLASLTFVLSVSSLALADVPPPNTLDCSGKKAGVACKKDDNSQGSCAASKCSRSVPPGPDGGGGGSAQYDCFICESGSSSGGTSTGGGGGCALGPSPGSALAMVGLAFAVSALASRKKRS
jgi:hypothetical protein